VSNPRILSVGQCAVDHYTISRYLSRDFDAVVTRAHAFDEALAALHESEFDLVLVNRVTDSDGTIGLDFIRALKSDPARSAVPILLVSNYAEAQAAALEIGALPGFGKAEIGTTKSREALSAALGRESSTR
jgi:two-component system chemotaxis response regulator CheY